MRSVLVSSCITRCKQTDQAEAKQDMTQPGQAKTVRTPVRTSAYVYNTKSCLSCKTYGRQKALFVQTLVLPTVYSTSTNSRMYCACESTSQQQDMRCAGRKVKSGHLAVQLELALRGAADHTHALPGAVKLQDVQDLVLSLLHQAPFALPHKDSGVGALVEEEAECLAGSYQSGFIW